jgi:hypothetical protein
MSNENEAESGSSSARSQIVVYFVGEPQIDYTKLCEFLNGCDPDEEDKFVVVTDKPALENPSLHGGEVRLSGAGLRLGDFVFMALGHDVPDPERALLDNPRIPAPMRETLKKHTGFVLVSLFGGVEYPPMERMVVLLKVAVGMFAQGGIGLSIPAFQMAYTAEFIEQLMRVPDTTLWQLMREEGEPSQLLTHTGLREKDGARWLCTIGNEFYGLPDFASRVANEKEYKKGRQFVDNLMLYLWQKGPVIEAGHTMGYDEKAIARFTEPSAEEQWLVPEGNELLIIRNEDGPKKSILSRFFGR